MCEAMDRLLQRFENQGIEKGKREEKLNELTLNIFNVTNEEDVLKIIN